MRRIRLLLLLVCLCLAAPASGEETFYQEMPALLRFTQNTQQEAVAKNVFLQRTYPDTASDWVDNQMRSLIDEMAEQNRHLLPQKYKGDNEPTLDVGAIVSRSGTSVLSFLTLAEYTKDRELLSVDYRTRVFDLETNKELTLCDLFADDSRAWELLSRAVRTQLSAAFPALEPNEEALDRLCAIESLKDAPFTLGAARLTLTYRADALYPGKNTLLHVYVYYPEIRPLMTPYGQQQTDNSRFRMIALTYDDGPARGNTYKVLDTLRSYGAQATFFIIGKDISHNHDILAHQQNRGYSIQSHSYTHVYITELKTSEVRAQEALLHQELGDLIGITPTLMRAPGGIDAPYVRRKIGYPMLHWSLSAGDSSNDNVKKIISRLQHSVKDNAVVLMHDINPKCRKYTKAFLQYLNECGYLCATVEELFCDAGVPLEPNTIYYSPDHVVE